jgi:cold shock CspA family protein
MMGVVLWSDQQVGKAVIWCEDQGKLAYVTGDQAEINTELELQAGDLVSFSLRMQSKLRFAENLTVVEENSYQGLNETLKSSVDRPSAKAEPIRDEGAEIIPFRAKAPQPRSVRPLVALAGA